MSKRYYIMGYYGYCNAGDDAMLIGICNELNRRKVQYRFYFKGNSPFKVFADILQSDVVVIGGGTHLRDWGKGWLFQGLRIVALGIFCRLIGKEFHMWNVGIDGKNWEKIARKICTFISIRDQETADSALLIDWQPNQEKQKIIGVNLSPVHSLYYGNSKLDWNILRNVCQSLSYLLNNESGWTVRFISLNSHCKYSDELEITDDVAKLFDIYFENAKVEIIPYKDNPVEVLSSIAECSLYIGMRYHANVFAFLAGVNMWRNYLPYSYPSVVKFQNAVNSKKILNLEHGKELARRGIKTE